MALDITWNDHEVDALLAVLQIIESAGRAAIDQQIIGMTPSERWEPFPIQKAIDELPRRVTQLVSHYGWERPNGPPEDPSELHSIQNALEQMGYKHSQAHLELALIAAAYWLDDDNNALNNRKGLIALEELNNLVNGYAQSLPVRLAPTTSNGEANRRFRAYQRRRNGYESTTRSPQLLVKRLPSSSKEILETYADRLTYGSTRASYAYAATIAVAIGRPLDETIIHQLEITMATAIIWRDLPGFPDDNFAHPLIGERTDENDHNWQKARQVINNAIGALAKNHRNQSDPKWVQTPARCQVANVQLNAKALESLQRLHDYVTLFSAWLAKRPLANSPAEEQIAHFDAAFRNNGPSVSSGAKIVASLPPSALKVVANFDALAARGKDGRQIAEELATALGDTDLANDIHRTLQVATAWLNGELSDLERNATDQVQILNTDQPDLSLFSSAKPRDAEALLDMGAAIGEIVSFSRTLGQSNGQSNQTPTGWWNKFHGHAIESLPSSSNILKRLPEGSLTLLKHYARLLESERFGDMTSAARALATPLGRMDEELCVRTLAIALSVGVVWSEMAATGRSVDNDTLLGVSPQTAHDKYVCGRAQAQLEWGLQELLRVETVVGV